MDRTRKLKLKYIVASQAQKEVTINEDLNVLDMLVQATAKGIANTPPESPAEGDMYIIGDAPAGAWEGKAKHLAGFFAGVWLIVAPRDGWRVWLDEGKAMRYQGGAWADEVYLHNGNASFPKDLTASSIYTNDWFRVNGERNGIHWQKYGGGWYMEDNVWIRAWNGKHIYTSGTMKADGGFEGNLQGTAANAEKLGGMTLDRLLAEIDRRIAAKQS